MLRNLYNQWLSEIVACLRLRNLQSRSKSYRRARNSKPILGTNPTRQRVSCAAGLGSLARLVFALASLIPTRTRKRGIVSGDASLAHASGYDLWCKILLRVGFISQLRIANQRLNL